MRAEILNERRRCGERFRNFIELGDAGGIAIAAEEEVALLAGSVDREHRTRIVGLHHALQAVADNTLAQQRRDPR